MKTRIVHWLSLISATFWVIPLLMLVLALLSAYAAINLDKTLFTGDIEPVSFLFYFNDIQNVRAMLSLTAGSILGVAGVSFSITIASLTLASQQFGPRLLRNFMQNYLNQLVIGIFIATFLYCVLMLQFTGAMDDEQFQPVISMCALMALIIVNLLVLVFFIHNTAASMQADAIISDVYDELKASLQRIFPESDAHQSEHLIAQLPKDLNQRFDEEGQVIAAVHSGYLQAIDKDTLKQVAEDNELSLRIHFKPGEYIFKGCDIASYLSTERVPEDALQSILGALIIGEQATEEQDVEYTVRQLVEIALRALSPGINDPFTARTCIQKLGDGLILMAHRAFPKPHYLDEDGTLRLQLKPYTYMGIVEASFNQIRQNGLDHVDVVITLLETLTTLAHQVEGEEQVEAVRAQVTAIQQVIRQKEGLATMDKVAIESRYEQALEVLNHKRPV